VTVCCIVDIEEIKFKFTITQLHLNIYSRFVDQSEEEYMKSSIRDKTEGKFHEVKGKTKEMAGKITDNPTLEAKGKAEKIAGKVQEKVGEVKKVMGK
jgi:uncharacterized protein YjbJ (UPF0337 family)